MSRIAVLKAKCCICLHLRALEETVRIKRRPLESFMAPRPFVRICLDCITRIREPEPSPDALNRAEG